MKQAEIYGLYCPDTDELRYVGKALDAQKRFRVHLVERKLNRPVNRWVKSLTDTGKVPVMRVLESVPYEQWEEAERRLIAKYRQTCKLLNLADGGAGPSQTKEQRKKAAKASNERQKLLHPAIQAVKKANFEMSRLHAKFLKHGDFYHAYHMKFMMRCYAADPYSITPASWLTL